MFEQTVPLWLVAGVSVPVVFLLLRLWWGARKLRKRLAPIHHAGLLIAKLDKVTAPVREMKVIKVKYTSANQLADTVRKMFQQFQQASRYGRRSTTTTGDSQQVTVTASPAYRDTSVAKRHLFNYQTPTRLQLAQYYMETV